MLEGEKLYKKIPEIICFKGKIEIELGNFSKASKTFKKLIKLVPIDASICMTYCDVLFLDESFEKCIQQSEVFKTKYPELEKEWNINILKCHVHLEHYNKAVSLIEEVF